MAINANPHILNRISAALAKPDTVILVGSGASVWAGLPSWKRLITELADEVDALGRNGSLVRKALDEGDLPLAASYGAFQLSRLQFGQFIRKACNTTSARFGDIHKKIVTLGPTCFITTNYDKLLEDAITSNPCRARPRVVRNNQAIELPEIVRSDSRDFIFKYHGDVDDAESIVLTREQYAQFLGIYNHVTVALESLLITRPILMIGFGLRDPDFISLKDSLSTAFKTSIGEHYAIMPDMDQTAIDYWNTMHNIEIATYPISVTPDGRQDHAALLQLLDLLQQKQSLLANISTDTPEEIALRLSRYARRVERYRPIEEPLPLQAHSTNPTRVIKSQPIDQVLKTHNNLVLLGPPGSGKSFVLRHFIAEQGSKLLEQCLEDSHFATLNGVTIPFFVNMQLFDGSIESILQGELPAGLKLSSLLLNYSSTIILDAANETPEAFLENDAFKRELLHLLETFPRCRVIVSGRTGGWAETIDLPKYELEGIEDRFVAQFMKGKNFTSRKELRSTLKLPLFFKLAASPDIAIEAAATPSDIHEMLVQYLNRRLLEDNIPVDLSDLFSPIAFSMITNGVEYFDFDDVKRSLSGDNLDSEITHLINSMIASNFVHALPGRRLTFFHQSITEYFASVELARRSNIAPSVISQCLSYRRWDNTIFLTLSRLPKEDALKFFRIIMKADLLAAFRATHHAKESRDDAIREILAELDRTNEQHDFETKHSLSFELNRLEFNNSHVDSLFRLAKRNTHLGGVATGKLIDLAPSHRTDFLRRLVDNDVDYNFCRELADRLSSSFSRDDLELLIASIEDNVDIPKDNFSCIGSVCRHLARHILFEAIDRKRSSSSRQLKLFFVEALRAIGHIDCIRWMLELANAGAEGWAASLHLMMFRLEKQVSDLAPDPELVRTLVNRSHDESSDRHWVLQLFRDIYYLGPGWQQLIIQSFGLLPLTVRIGAALVSESEKERASAHAMLEKVIDSLTSDDIEALSDWAVDALAPMVVAKRRVDILSSVMMQLTRPSRDRSIAFRKILEQRHSRWWLDWIVEMLDDATSHSLICVLNLSNSFKGDALFKNELINEIEKRDNRTFSRLLRYVAPAIEISTDDLSAEVQADLTKRFLPLKSSVGASVVGLLASESFCLNKLVPLWESGASDGSERHGLKQALQVSGRRHNRRYCW